jgi:threonine 3-dehydrogenase
MNNKTMRALCKKEAKEGIWMIEASVPEIGPDDVLIKIRKTAICGTDLHIYKWDAWAAKTVPVPLITGHEYVGEIAKTGANVKNLTVGQRVSGEGHLACGTCRNCRGGKMHLCIKTVGVGVNRQGCFAEYFALPASNVFPLSDAVSDDVASFFDPLGNAVHTALSFDLVGEDVLITGAGPIGVMAVAICRHAGARHVVITDVNDYRLGLAQKMGATRAVNVTRDNLKTVMKDLGMTEGFDVGLEMSGNPAALRQMTETTRHGGKIALLGIPPADTAIDWSLVIFKGLILKGIYGREMYETWYKMKSIVEAGLDVSPVITHIFPANDYQKAFDAMLEGNTGKVILDWTV